ncbi:MAG: hypothetical protein RLN87_06640, partial [Parasphingopyxis sp.]|uniref:hypothetical protein n=1 Tax=Parasphingopyxis sp. TaxID=1920299 RepID=UPI0032EEFA71
MREKLKIAMAAAATIASGTAHAQESSDFCADVERVVAARGDTPVFASLPIWSSDTEPMFAFGTCGVFPGRERPTLDCAQYDHERLGVSRYLGVPDIVAVIADRIADCRPDAVRSETADPPPLPNQRVRVTRNEYGAAFVDIEGVRFAPSYEMTSRFSRVGFEAYDCAARAEIDAENRAEAIRRRESWGRPLASQRPFPPLDPPCGN